MLNKIKQLIRNIKKNMICELQDTKHLLKATLKFDF